MRRAAFVLAALAVAGWPALPAEAEGRLMASRASVRFTNARTCDVVQAFSVQPGGAERVAHRLIRFPDTVIDGVDVTGAAAAGQQPAEQGRTVILSVSSSGAASLDYEIRYRARMAAGWDYRCPLWLPDTPSTGALGRMQLDVSLPESATPAPDSFPALAWEGRRGSGALSNLPAAIRVPFVSADAQVSWLDRIGLRRAVDLLVVGVIVLASALWSWRRRVR